MGRLAFGPVFVAAAVSIAFYVGLYFALRPHTPSKASLVGDIDIEAEFSERMSSRNRTPHYARVLLFDLLPYGASVEAARTFLGRLASENNVTHLSSSEIDEVPLEAHKGQIFAQTITRMASHNTKPLILDRYHIFVDFEKSASLPRVALAALVSDPVERFVSSFRLNRLSGHWRSRLSKLPERERRMRLQALLNSEWAAKNLSHCVLINDPECVPPPGAILPSLVSHFCGPDPTCRVVGSRIALEQAKYNLETAFSVVGVVGRESDTLRAFDAYLPLFMKGASKFRTSLGGGHAALKFIQPAVRKRIMRVLANDIELFRFAQRRLDIQVSALEDKKKK